MCTLEVTEELKCKWCSHLCHFKCIIGREVKNVSNRAYFGHAKNFVCPVCIVGRNNVLTLKAMSANQAYIQLQHAVDFTLNLSSSASSPAGDRSSAAPSDDEDDVEAAEPHLEPPPSTPVAAHVGQNNPDSPHVQQPDTVEHPVHERRQQDIEAATDECTPSPGDVTRSKRLTSMLNTLHTMPHHKTTLIMGDSNTHGVSPTQVDPENDSVAVKSFGGLCIVAAVYALQQYKLSHKHVKRAVWSLGTNDALHEGEHCLEESDKYMKALYKETSRIFPKASVEFLLPFSGIQGVSEKFRQDLGKSLKINCPRIKVHHMPSMRNKLNKDGVHINWAGKRAYIEFLMKRFTKCNPQQQLNQQPQSDHATYRYSTSNFPSLPGERGNQPSTNEVRQNRAAPANQDGDFRVQNPLAPQGIPNSYQTSNSYSGHPGLANDIAVALTNVLKWQSQQQQQCLNRFPAQWPPQIN